MTRQNISSSSPYEDVFGYCRAVRVGDHVHVSGTTAQPPHVEGCDAEEQARSAIDIIERALREAGAELSDVVRTVTYLVHVDDMPAVARAHLDAFGDIRPAATLVEVSTLIDPAYLVEIEAYAIVDAGG